MTGLNKKDMSKDSKKDNENPLNIIYIIKQIWGRKKIIFISFLVFVSVTAIISLFLPSIYMARTTLMAVASAPDFISIPGLNSMPGLRPDENAQKILSIFHSRTIKDYVIKSLNLIEKVLGEEEVEASIKPISIVREMLDEIVIIRHDLAAGQIWIEAHYNDPIIARDIANQYVTEARKILKEKALTSSKMNRIFIEERITLEKSCQERYETEKSEFQAKHKITDPQIERERGMRSYPHIYRQKVALETELREVEGALSENNPRIITLKKQIRAIGREMEKAIGMVSKKKQSVDKITQLADMNMKIQTSKSILKSLRKMLEQARYAEAKDDIYVEVIDPAIAPYQRYKPKRGRMVAMAGFFSIFFGVMLIFIMEWVEQTWGLEIEKIIKNRLGLAKDTIWFGKKK